MSLESATLKYEEVEMELDGMYNDIVVRLNKDGIIESTNFEVSQLIILFPRILEFSSRRIIRLGIGV